MGTWKTLEHTADLALEARGRSREDALEALCEGLLAQLTDPAAVHGREEVRLEAEGIDRAETLVGLLGEILYWANARGWVFREAVAVPPCTDHRAVLLARGEPRDPERHPPGTEIKAATYHELRFEPSRSGRGWVARVIFDT